MFNSVLSNTQGVLSMQSAFLCMCTSFILGLIIAYVHYLTQKSSKDFIISLAVLPLLVQVIITMVNGNLGTSVAVLGAFSLIRFRSIPGKSRELISVFLSMAVGLATGMGYVTFAIAFTIIASIILIVLSKLKIAEKDELERVLKITIPEDLDYTDIFDDVFAKYLKNVDLEKVKTTNMGSMYELTYKVKMDKEKNQKEFIDELRCRNGNLKIILGREEQECMEL